MTVIGTGGVASLFEGATNSIDHFDPDLTIRGLLRIKMIRALADDVFRALDGDARQLGRRLVQGL